MGKQSYLMFLDVKFRRLADQSLSVALDVTR